MSQAHVAVHDLEAFNEDILSNLSGSCYTIVGSPIDLKVCWSYDASKREVYVRATIVGQKIVEGCLSASNPKLGGCLSLAVVKACIDLTFDPNTLCLGYAAKTCHYMPFEWHCAKHSGNIVCFK